MTVHTFNPWEIAAGLAALAAAVVLVLWLIFRKRPTAEELERARRQFLVQMGRIADGMLLDICEVEAKDGRRLTMLLYSCRIGGVDYECSQDITDLREVVDAREVRAGFPCSVRYQPGNPQNSIVVAEHWTGLRMGLPQLPLYDDPNPIDLSHLRPGGADPLRPPAATCGGADAAGPARGPGLTQLGASSFERLLLEGWETTVLCGGYPPPVY